MRCQPKSHKYFLCLTFNFFIKLLVFWSLLWLWQCSTTDTVTATVSSLVPFWMTLETVSWGFPLKSSSPGWTAQLWTEFWSREILRSHTVALLQYSCTDKWWFICYIEIFLWLFTCCFENFCARQDVKMMRRRMKRIARMGARSAPRVILNLDNNWSTAAWAELWQHDDDDVGTIKQLISHRCVTQVIILFDSILSWWCR